MYILKKVDSSIVLIDLPDFLHTAYFHTSNNCHGNQACQHNNRLEHICPNDRLEASLQKFKRSFYKILISL